MSWKDPVQEAYWKRHGKAIRARRRARYAKQRRAETVAEREQRLVLQRADCARYRQAHPERVRQSSSKSRKKHMRRGRYGLSYKDVACCLRSQGRRCAICKRRFSLTTVCADYDHATGRFRGLLCRKCNLGLGHFNDSIPVLRAAQSYLRHHE